MRMKTPEETYEKLSENAVKRKERARRDKKLSLLVENLFGLIEEVDIAACNGVEE